MRFATCFLLALVALVLMAIPSFANPTVRTRNNVRVHGAFVQPAFLAANIGGLALGGCAIPQVAVQQAVVQQQVYAQPMVLQQAAQPLVQQSLVVPQIGFRTRGIGLGFNALGVSPFALDPLGIGIGVDPFFGARFSNRAFVNRGQVNRNVVRNKSVVRTRKK